MHTRRTVLRTGGLAIAGGLAGCGGSTSEQPETTTIDMTDSLDFEPETVTVGVGDTVDWVTVGAVAHSVTAYEADLPDGAAYFASGGFETESAARSGYPDGSVGQDETYSHTFETDGEFPYFCIPHESGMVGTVVVEA